VIEGKTLPAAFYATPGGREPVREWLRSLDVADRRLVGQDIATAEFGWPVGMPVCRSLGNGLWEVRSGISDGRIARVIFAVVGPQVVLLHGFVKKTRKTPKRELEVAARRLREIGP